MKTIKTLCFLFILGATLTITAQTKQYSFAVYLSNGTASSSCLDIKKAYVSPIKSYSYNTYHPTEAENKMHDLWSSWSKKCQAQFNISNTYCWGINKKTWYSSHSKADMKRDDEIANLKRLGYNVYDSFSFGFSFE